MFGSFPAKGSHPKLSPTRACPRGGRHGLTIKQSNSVYSDTLTVLHLSNVSVYVETMRRPSSVFPTSSRRVWLVFSSPSWNGGTRKTRRHMHAPDTHGATLPTLSPGPPPPSLHPHCAQGDSPSSPRALSQAAPRGACVQHAAATTAVRPWTAQFQAAHITERLLHRRRPAGTGHVGVRLFLGNSQLLRDTALFQAVRALHQGADMS